jgi:hypothetical protein
MTLTGFNVPILYMYKYAPHIYRCIEKTSTEFTLPPPPSPLPPHFWGEPDPPSCSLILLKRKQEIMRKTYLFC